MGNDSIDFTQTGPKPSSPRRSSRYDRFSCKTRPLSACSQESLPEQYGAGRRLSTRWLPEIRSRAARRERIESCNTVFHEQLHEQFEKRKNMRLGKSQ
jgi:hypothetical protein